MSVLNTQQIMDILPHRSPFLLIDTVEELQPGVKCVAKKNVTMNEPHFMGHFPGNPVMPGVLQLEAMAQVGGVALLYPEEYRGKIALFGSMDKVKFRKPVTPGDQLRMVAEIVKIRGNIGKVWAQSFVDGAVVAEAEFMFALA